MNLLGKIGLWGLVAGATASGLSAEPAGGWLSPNGPGGTTTVNPTTAPADQPRPAVVLSGPDVQARVHLLHESTRADARHVQHLQQIARREKDVIKLNCVNDKLVQIKPELNIVDAAAAELEGATDANRMMMFGNVTQAAENVRRLREEADQCIGEAITQGGESSNSFTAPPAPDDPTKGFTDTPIEPPGYASPFD
ncbi:MAG TPA: hypothetical protein VFK02_18050 [Kofleriaceae bacterium]|nr:hypothetical protein [Kofleriaceae bacterium]